MKGKPNGIIKTFNFLTFPKKPALDESGLRVQYAQFYFYPDKFVKVKSELFDFDEFYILHCSHISYLYIYIFAHIVSIFIYYMIIIIYHIFWGEAAQILKDKKKQIAPFALVSLSELRGHFLPFFGLPEWGHLAGGRCG